MAVTADMIATQLGRPLSDAERAQADLWIADALADISARATLHGKTLADLDPAVVDRVVREAVAARLSQPADGVTQYDVTVDDTRVSRHYAGQRAGLTYLPAWWSWLGLVAAEGKAFEINTMPPQPVADFTYYYQPTTGYLL